MFRIEKPICFSDKKQNVIAQTFAINNINKICLSCKCFADCSAAILYGNGTFKIKRKNRKKDFNGYKRVKLLQVML